MAGPYNSTLLSVYLHGFFLKKFFIDDQELLQIPLNELIELNDKIALALFITVMSK